MSFEKMTVCVCDYEDCGHRWLPRQFEEPKRCARCKRLGWNRKSVTIGVKEPESVTISVDRPQESPSVTIGESAQKVEFPSEETLDTRAKPERAPACRKKDHVGFWRQDGYWCISCGKVM